MQWDMLHFLQQLAGAAESDREQGGRGEQGVRKGTGLGRSDLRQLIAK